jgi:hypothetical protein
LSQYLPPKETYDLVDIEVDENYSIKNLSVYYEGKWQVVPLVWKGYVDVIFVNDTYYLLTNLGIEAFMVADKFPISVAESDAVYTTYKSKLFSTDDGRYVGFFSIDYTEFGGSNDAYGIGVYDILNKTFFDGHMTGGEFRDVVFNDGSAERDPYGISFEKFEVVYSPEELTSPFEGGEFVIDLINLKFFVREL